LVSLKLATDNRSNWNSKSLMEYVGIESQTELESLQRYPEGFVEVSSKVRKMSVVKMSRMTFRYRRRNRRSPKGDELWYESKTMTHFVADARPKTEYEGGPRPERKIAFETLHNSLLDPEVS